MEIVVSIFPVFLFTAFLFLLDSFKLVIKKYLAFALLWGIASAVLAYFCNNFILDVARMKPVTYSRYLAPAIEEAIKLLFIFLILSRKRIGFMTDAAIYGFAVGAGFALAENIFFLKTAGNSNLLVWIIRGLGTATMHGTCTSLASIILIGGKSRNTSFLLSITLAVATAYVIHSAFNHFYVNPIWQTIAIIILAPILFILIFKLTETQLQKWLEIEFSSEIELLKMINQGRFLSTRSGQFLASLQSRFVGETILDMYCFISLYLELSVKAKRNVMLRENGFPVMAEKDTGDKILELKQLRKRIGKVGELTLAPLIRMNYRSLWKLTYLE